MPNPIPPFSYRFSYRGSKQDHRRFLALIDRMKDHDDDLPKRIKLLDEYLDEDAWERVVKMFTTVAAALNPEEERVRLHGTDEALMVIGLLSKAIQLEALDTVPLTYRPALPLLYEAITAVLEPCIEAMEEAMHKRLNPED